MRGLLKIALISSVLLAGCQTDLYTKRLAAEQLRNRRDVTLIQGYLNLRYTENSNGAFGLLHQLRPGLRQPVLVGLKLAAVLAVCGVLLANRRRSFGRQLPFLLVLSGALGNLVDRVRNGFVVDFVHLHVRDAFSWPFFNVADILIFAGVALLFLRLLRGGTRERAAEGRTG